MSNTEKSEKPEEKKLTLTQALRDVPEGQFWAVRDETPHYNRAFGAVAKVLFAGCLKSASDLLEAIAKGDRLNLSSFQRAVAKEAERRRNPSTPKKAAKQVAKSLKRKTAKKSKLL